MEGCAKGSISDRKQCEGVRDANADRQYHGPVLPHGQGEAVKTDNSSGVTAVPYHFCSLTDSRFQVFPCSCTDMDYT